MLVGFDMYAEFRWISQECPQLASLFAAWVDIQEIIEKKLECPGPSLISAMNALGITDRSKGTGKKSHRASNDAVRCLAVLCGLISSNSPSHGIPCREHKVCVFQKMPQFSRCSHAHTNPFTAFIPNSDGGILPTQYTAPRSLVGLFAKYELKAVAFNSREFLKHNGVRTWWISLSNLKSLEHLAADVHGSVINGKTLQVQSVVAPHINSMKECE